MADWGGGEEKFVKSEDVNGFDGSGMGNRIEMCD
jgi:hypothetical protein